ncbi:hypothetical protein BASA81_008747 [Batrachochytrium salamandrivorans]|nr:hypothetical protein BASA81_008747 [Batrachochytrium salamandrivorans]
MKQVFFVALLLVAVAVIRWIYLGESAMVGSVHGVGAVVVLSSLAASTLVPNSLAPNSLAPTTLAPNSLAPTTLSPSSLAPSSLAPTTLSPSSLAPTIFSPTTLSPTIFSPTKSNHTLWNVPLPNQPIASSFGDYEWTYPAGITPNEFIQKRYVANEHQVCKSRYELCCVLGGGAAGRGKVSNGCQVSRIDFMAEFSPLPNRPLFSLVDALLAWRKANPNAQKQFQMIFMGDSVTGQIYTAALCELARNSKVKSLTFDMVLFPPQHARSRENRLSFQESHVTLHGHEGFDFTLLYICEYQLSTNPKAIQAFLADTDVAVFGWGLHYAQQMHKLPKSLQLIANELRVTPTRKRTLLWMGAVKQHFRYNQTDPDVSGEYVLKQPHQYCAASSRFPVDHPKFQPINQYVFDYFTTKLNISASWFKWNARPKLPHHQSMPHIHFLPFAELTSPFYRNYRYYNANPLFRVIDCTHNCWIPNLYEPFWDAMFLIVNGDNTTTTQYFPAGTQQYPNMVNWTLPFLFDNITHRLALEHL